MDDVFVGRSRELAAIDTLIGRTVKGAVGAIVFVGEPGIGKSRLLREAERRLSPRRIVRLAGYEPERAVPLAAAAPLLRRLAEGDHESGFHGLLRDDAGPGELDAVRVFESVHRRLRRERATIMFVDDLQWVDSLSLALLHYVARAVASEGRGFALVAVSRPSTQADGFVSSLIGALGGPTHAELIRVATLEREDGIQLVSERAPGTDRDRAIELWQQSGGSPFWLELLLTTDGGGRDLAEVVGERARGLSGDATSLLGALAVIGRPVTTDDLEGYLAWPEPRVSSASAELAARGLEVVEGGRARIAHDLLRAAAVENMPAVTRRQFHARIAERLETIAGDDVTLLLAAVEHRSGAGEFDEQLALRILRSPRRRLIGSAGLRDLAALAGREERPDRWTLAEAVGTLAAELGDQDLALEQWSAIAARSPDRNDAARAALGAASAAFNLGDPVDAREWLAAFRRVRPATPGLEIVAETLEARILLWLEHRAVEGRASANRAVELARAALGEAGPEAPSDRAPAPVQAAYLDALVAGWEAAIQVEDIDAIVELADESVAASPGADLRGYLAAQSMKAMAFEYAAEMEKSAERYRLVWDEALRAVMPMEAIDAGFRLAAVLFDLLRLDEASAIAAQAEELVTRTGDHGRVRDRTRLVRFQVSFARDDWRAGARAFLAAAEREPDPHYRLVYHQLLAVWLARLGADGQEAAAQIQLARSFASGSGCPGCTREVEVAAMEVFARLGRVAEAREAVTTWDSAGHPSFVENEWLRRRAGILIDADRGSSSDLAAAIPALLGLRDEAGATGLVFHALWAELDAARLASVGDPTTAVESYRRAAVGAEASGARTLLRLADQGLRALGARPWRRGPGSGAKSGLAALSEREREVAELVATGASNGDIAAQLFLARKTVEHHVSNVLAKLDLRTRTELAAAVARGSERPVSRNGGTPR